MGERTSCDPLAAVLLMQPRTLFAFTATKVKSTSFSHPPALPGPQQQTYSPVCLIVFVNFWGSRNNFALVTCRNPSLIREWAFTVMVSFAVVLTLCQKDPHITLNLWISAKHNLLILDDWKNKVNPFLQLATLHYHWLLDTHFPQTSMEAEEELMHPTTDCFKCNSRCNAIN